MTWRTNPQTGQLEWVPDAGTGTITPPGAMNAVPHPFEITEGRMEAGEANAGLAPLMNWLSQWDFTGQGRQGGAAVPAATPPPAAGPFSILDRPEIPFPTAVGAGTTAYTPEHIAPPPERTVDPSLAGREQYAQGREGRISALLEQAIRENSAEGQWARPWWQRLLALVGPMASAPPGQMGAVGANELAGWTANDRAIRAENMRLALGLEDVRGETAEAGFARQSGEHQVGEGNRERTYGVDVQNTMLDNSAEQSNVAEQNANARSSAGQALQLAIARYEALQGRQDAALGMAAQMGGPGGFSAFGSMFSDLDPTIQQGVMEQQARTGLTSTIEIARAAGGSNENNQRRAIHAEMERLAGTTIPRPPRNAFGSTEALVRYYTRNGVQLNNPGIIQNYPGFAASPAD